jgi:hypothetical protein
LTPLYEIVTKGDDSYEKAATLLENLKNALTDVNDLRNEPIILKIQSEFHTKNRNKQKKINYYLLKFFIFTNLKLLF